MQELLGFLNYLRVKISLAHGEVGVWSMKPVDRCVLSVSIKPVDRCVECFSTDQQETATYHTQNKKSFFETLDKGPKNKYF